ncbi:MFS transporter [Vineibacter terrae]|uniref:MFS transporter n=1 Tax=Vineibacter terrae TaxID=2586908 RepID=UPI002E382026|nr:MFS transporter [Vineibacter terrae]HEX2891928.1 MFS transporter [Vineibacter terrae]
MATPARTATDWALVWLLIATGLAVASQVGKVPPSLPAIRAELGIDLRAAGWFVSLINLMTALVGVLVALTADRVGHRRLAVAGLLAGVLASAAGALTTSASTLFACRIVEGLGFLAVVVSVPTLLLRLTAPHDVRRVMALWGAYLPGGAGLMALASAILLPTVGWRGVWWTTAGVLVLAMASILSSAVGRGRNAAPRGEPRSLGRDLRDVGASRGALAIGACFGFYASSWLALVGFLPTLQIERLGIDPVVAAATTAGVITANVIGTIVAGALLHRGWQRLTILVATAAIMALTAAGVFLDLLPPLLRLVTAFVFSAVSSAIPGALFAAVPVHAPRPALVGATTGMLMQGSNIGLLLGPPVVAALVAAGGWPWALLYTTPALGGAALAAWALHRAEQRLGRRA